MRRLMKPPAPLRSHASTFRLAFLHDDVVGMRRTLSSGRAPSSPSEAAYDIGFKYCYVRS